MRKTLLITALMALLLACASVAWADEGDNEVDTSQLPDSSFVYEVSIADLQSAESYLEHRTVQITGEVVGDIVRDEADENGRWITVNALPGEPEASIQVHVTADQAAKIDTLGRYQTTGSTVSIMGEYHLVCGQHDGLTDLHAQTFSVTHAGYTHRVHFSLDDFTAPLLLVAAGLAFFALYRRKREEQR